VYKHLHKTRSQDVVLHVKAVESKDALQYDILLTVKNVIFVLC
jgi:hypothetical protein